MTNVEMNRVLEAVPGSVRIEEIIAGASQLKDILAEETDLLSRMEVGGLAQLQDKKQEIISSLDKKKKLIAHNRLVLAAYSAAEKERLVKLNAELDRAMAENAMQLIKAKEVNQMVVDAIASALKHYFSKSRGYNKHASDANNFRRGEQAVPPMAINQTT